MYFKMKWMWWAIVTWLFWFCVRGKPSSLSIVNWIDNDFLSLGLYFYCDFFKVVSEMCLVYECKLSQIMIWRCVARGSVMEQELKQGRQVINRGLLALYIKMSKAPLYILKNQLKNNAWNDLNIHTQ